MSFSNVPVGKVPLKAWIGPQTPWAHIVLGSGFGSALSESESWARIESKPFGDFEGLSQTTVVDHPGKFEIWECRKQGHPAKQRRILFQLGRLHGYEGHSPREVVAPVMAGREAGIDRFILTNAAGGVARSFGVGDVMVIRDHINFTGQNPLTGKNPVNSEGVSWGPRFPDLSSLYHSTTREALIQSMEQVGVRAHQGVYLGVSGPSFETPAEVQLFSSWGVGSVGMSTVWEAIALAHSGARLGGLSLISNPASGISGVSLEHEKIVEACRQSASKIIQGLFQFCEGSWE